MSYLTLKAEIKDGQVLVNEPDQLPRTARALVTILESIEANIARKTPLEALEALQDHLKLNHQTAAQWIDTIQNARR